MSSAVLLTTAEVREFVQDYDSKNHLIDGVEFTDTFITLCMDLAVSSFNSMAPVVTKYNMATFPDKAIMLWGTLWHMYNGAGALYARNTMTYSDGGINIPIEERYALYAQIAQNFEAMFKAQGQALKNQINMESGWNNIASDERMIPYY